MMLTTETRLSSRQLVVLMRCRTIIRVTRIWRRSGKLYLPIYIFISSVYVSISYSPILHDICVFLALYLIIKLCIFIIEKKPHWPC